MVQEGCDPVLEITVGHQTFYIYLNILALIGQNVPVENCLKVHTSNSCYYSGRMLLVTVLTNHKCLIKITFVQTMCLSIFYCLFQTLGVSRFPLICPCLLYMCAFIKIHTPDFSNLLLVWLMPHIVVVDLMTFLKTKTFR